MALVRERTIPTERPPPVGEVSASFLRIEGCHVVSATDPHGLLIFVFWTGAATFYSSSSSIDTTRKIKHKIRIFNIPSEESKHNISKIEYWIITLIKILLLNFYTHSDDSLFNTEICSRFLISRYIVVVEGVTLILL